MPSPFHIALCSNGTMLPGLHATLFSLVGNLGQRDRVILHIFIQDIEEADLEDVRRTINSAGGVGILRFKPTDVSAFKGLRPLQGDRMTYMRLDLPQLIPDAEQILYLDSDLIVNADVSHIFEHDLGSSVLGAAGVIDMAWMLEHDFFEEMGLKKTDACFNCGVLLFNARAWREQNLTGKSMEFGIAHSDKLQSADQTILNALFYDNFYHLPEKFNRMVYPEVAYQNPSDGIFHFLGSPKPWDFGGSGLTPEVGQIRSVVLPVG